MKKIYLTITMAAALLLATNTQAQLIIKGGANFTNYFTENNSGDQFDFDGKVGYHVGITGEAMIGKILGFETGVIMDSRGAKNGSSNAFGSYEVDFNPIYATVPLNLKLKPALGDLKLFVTAGPYVSIGVLGKVMSEGSFAGFSGEDERDIKWGDDESDDDLRRFDYGMSLGGGIQLSSLILGVEYSYGLANIAADQSNDNTMQNRMMRFSVGFLLGGE